MKAVRITLRETETRVRSRLVETTVYLPDNYETTMTNDEIGEFAVEMVNEGHASAREKEPFSEWEDLDSVISWHSF